MKDLTLVASQTPSVVTFDNYAEVKAGLRSYIQTFADVDYSVEGVDAAASDRDQLKKDARRRY